MGSGFLTHTSSSPLLPWPSHTLSPPTLDSLWTSANKNKLVIPFEHICLVLFSSSLFKLQALFQWLHLSKRRVHTQAPYLILYSAHGITEWLDLHWSEWCSSLCNIKKGGLRDSAETGYKWERDREHVGGEDSESAEIIFLNLDGFSFSLIWQHLRVHSGNEQKSDNCLPN